MARWKTNRSPLGWFRTVVLGLLVAWCALAAWQYWRGLHSIVITPISVRWVDESRTKFELHYQLSEPDGQIGKRQFVSEVRLLSEAGNLLQAQRSRVIRAASEDSPEIHLRSRMEPLSMDRPVRLEISRFQGASRLDRTLFWLGRQMPTDAGRNAIWSQVGESVQRYRSEEFELGDLPTLDH